MDCRVKTRNILLSDFLQIPVSILDLMDCRVKTWLMPISGENLSIVSILDLMDCRVKTEPDDLIDWDISGFNP